MIPLLQSRPAKARRRSGLQAPLPVSDVYVVAPAICSRDMVVGKIAHIMHGAVEIHLARPRNPWSTVRSHTLLMAITPLDQVGRLRKRFMPLQGAVRCSAGDDGVSGEVLFLIKGITSLEHIIH